MIGEYPAPVTYRVCGRAYVHRWWRFERPYRVFELNVEFESEAYHAALRAHGVGCVFLATDPVTRDAFFTAIAAYQRCPRRLPRVCTLDRTHAMHVRSTCVAREVL